MVDATLTTSLDPARARRLLAAACDNIRGLESSARDLEAELVQSRAEALQLRATLDSSPFAALSKRITLLRNKVLPLGSGRRTFVRWLTGRSRRVQTAPAPDPYPGWIERHEPRLFAQLPKATEAAPYLHFLLTGEGSAVEASLHSILAQTDPNWRVLLAAARPFPVADERILTVRTPAHISPAAAWNRAMELALDGYVAVVRPGDRLAPGAVAALRCALEKEPPIGMIYSDEDAIDNAGRRFDPLFKPDWSPETFRSTNYLGNLTAFHLPLVREVGGFRYEFGDAAVYDLALRVSEKTAAIHHTPLVLYHSAKALAATEGSDLASSRAVQEHLDRLHIAGEVAAHSPQGVRQIRYHVARPLVSIIIPSKDQPRLLERCVESILTGEYPNQEIVLVDTGSVTAEAREVNARLAARPGVGLLHWDQPFNYSAVNNFAVRQARGEVLTFLNDDTEAINPDWLERLLEHALQPTVGAVGAKLLYSDGRLQHGGVVLGIKNLICGHLLQCAPDAAVQPLAFARNVSAVTGACLMMRRSVFEQVGGFEEQFAGDYNDVDLCLKAGQQGFQVIWTPYARLFHHECQTRGTIMNPARHALFALERLLFLDRWGAVLVRGDPFYNPNLNDDEADCKARR